MEEENTHCLYRHFDKDGNLLYIGTSLSVMSRTSHHHKISPWFNKITSITIERFPGRYDAARAEKKAILEEYPIHNKMFNIGNSRLRLMKKSAPAPVSELFTPRQREILKFLEESKRKTRQEEREWYEEFYDNYNRDFPSEDGEYHVPLMI